ncbi:hypothetical protein IHE61_28040 [Streptomyces sp. GKU 257-1]|nr:hypothetical protein [Streptomyces sp. GKU 257-1]
MVPPRCFEQIGDRGGRGRRVQHQRAAQFQHGDRVVQPPLGGRPQRGLHTSVRTGAGRQQPVLGTGLEEDVGGERGQRLLGRLQRRDVGHIVLEDSAFAVRLGQLPQRVGGDPRGPPLPDPVADPLQLADQRVEEGGVAGEGEAQGQVERGGVQFLRCGVGGHGNVLVHRRGVAAEARAEQVEVREGRQRQLVGEREGAHPRVPRLDVRQRTQHRRPVPGDDAESGDGRAQGPQDGAPERLVLRDGFLQRFGLGHQFPEHVNVLRLPRRNDPGVQRERTPPDSRVPGSGGQHACERAEVVDDGRQMGAPRRGVLVGAAGAGRDDVEQQRPQALQRVGSGPGREAAGPALRAGAGAGHRVPRGRHP